MHETTPEVAAILDSLADLCREALSTSDRRAEDRSFEMQVQPLVRALKSNGYRRTQDMPLQAKLENLVLEKSTEPAVHRRAELTNIAGKVQRMFDEVVRWESHSPTERSGTGPANISSATDH